MKCEIGFIFSDNLDHCIELNLEYCQTIDRLTGKCSLCSNGFILNDGECEKAPEIPNCLNYSPLTRFLCLECGLNSVKSEVQKCSSVEYNIFHCVYYDEKNKCVQCDEGYFLPDCLPILFSENCLIKKPDEQKCTKCNDRSILFQESCFYKQDLGFENCATDGFEYTQKPYSCSICNRNAEIFLIKPFMSTCNIESLQDFFTGKCERVKINTLSKSLKTTFIINRNL